MHWGPYIVSAVCVCSFTQVVLSNTMSAPAGVCDPAADAAYHDNSDGPSQADYDFAAGQAAFESACDYARDQVETVMDLADRTSEIANGK